MLSRDGDSAAPLPITRELSFAESFAQQIATALNTDKDQRRILWFF